MLYFAADCGVPFSQPVLDGGEFGELALPIREYAKGFGVAVMVEFTAVNTKVRGFGGTCRSSLLYLGRRGDHCHPRNVGICRCCCRRC